jgi:macrolide transport system ATP-binding/permease protein
MTLKSVLRLRGIHREFGSGSRVQALRDINLDVCEGEMVAIMGPSGAGKSTLLNILGLLDSPSGGVYELHGASVTDLTERQKNDLRANTFGFVFQAAHMLPHETSAQNVALSLAIKGVPFRSRHLLVQEALLEVGLLHRHENLARTLSGGERQRLAIARALVTNPSIILADEPTGNLDSRNTKEVLALLQKLRRDGRTIVLITHDVEVAAVADRTVILRDGVLAADGSAAENMPTSDQKVHNPASKRVHRRHSILERFGEATSNLTSRPLRTLLLVCAFMLGTGGLVAATGIAETASMQISSRLTEGALNRLTVFMPTEATPDGQVEHVRNIERLMRVEGAAENVPVERAEAAVATIEDAQETSLSARFAGDVLGVGSDFPELLQAEVRPSTAMRELDSPTESHVAIMGNEAAAELGYGPDRVGYQIWILGRVYTVIGVADSSTDERIKNAILIPRSNVAEKGSQIEVRTEMGYPAAVAQAIPLAVNPGNPGEVEVSTVGDLRNLSIGVADDLGTLVALTSSVLLAMAMLSAGTAMFLSVQSRTQEIALRRAIGMSKSGVYSSFIAEGALVGCAGGVAGVALGLASIVSTSAVQAWTAILPASAIMVGLAAGLGGGILAAVVPAWAAARIEPAQAIR